MTSFATYNASNGRWLATLATGLLVLATAYSRMPTPTWTWALPPARPAMLDDARSGSQPLLPASTTASLSPTSAWHPVAQWLAAGAGPAELAIRLPQAGWPLASQASAQASKQAPDTRVTPRFANTAKTLLEK